MIRRKWRARLEPSDLAPRSFQVTSPPKTVPTYRVRNQRQAAKVIINWPPQVAFALVAVTADSRLAFVAVGNAATKALVVAHPLTLAALLRRRNAAYGYLFRNLRGWRNRVAATVLAHDPAEMNGQLGSTHD